ncbi:PAS domain S-box protein [Patescibacteria group bacterium]|nr:MAG: PAS domain S-box protein [Patescibacteria group bacterium]
MKLRTKFILFFGTFLFIIALSISLYTQYIVGGIFKHQAVSNLRIIAEQSESAYLSFLGAMKVRVIDWTSDAALRDRAKAVMNSPIDSKERELAAKEFGRYVVEKKMPFDKTIFITDLLDKNGIVIASSQQNRIGKNELEEETEHGKVHDIENTLNSKFGDAFFGTIVLDGDENPDPSLSVTVRLFEPMSGDVREPLDLVLLVYYSNVMEIADVLGSGTSIYAGIPSITGRLTQGALLEEYETSDLYLVNNDRYLVTPSRSVRNVMVKQKVDTLPVRECLEKGKEINEEYDNYLGVRVLGASMCFQNEGIVVLAEVEKQEIFEPLTTLIKHTTTVGTTAFAFGILIIVLFLKRPLEHIYDIVSVAKKVEGGNLNVSTNIETNDELGYLSSSFNKMIESVRNTQKDLRASKHHVEEEKAKDEALLASLGEGMVATDKSGNIIAINRMAEEMLGWKSDEVIGKKAVDVWSMLDENRNEVPAEQRPITIATTGTSVISNTSMYNRKDDGYFPVAITVNPVMLDEKVIGSIAIFRDITREKELEKTRGDLLSLASHQLRTPLSGTKWLIETLKTGLHGSLTSGQTEYLNEIYKINERMTGLVHDMLGVLRMEGDTAKPKNEDVSIKTIMATLFETFHGVAESKGMRVELPEKTDYTVNTDPLLLRNILESFISNAINYSNPGGSVVINIKEKDSELIFSVKDSGIGIPRSEQRQIFERFYRASNAKTFDTRGSGLGLYIASMLAKKIGARVSFESEEGRGSTFYVHVPCRSANSLPENVTSV